LRNLFAAMLVILAAALIVFTGIAAENELKQQPLITTENTISVTGMGELYARPDLALTTFSVVTEKPTVQEAMAANAESMNAIIDAVQGEGVEQKDIKTTSFNIYPRYEYQNEAGIRVMPPHPTGKRVLVAYEITQSVQVKMRYLDNVGTIIQAATNAGANQVGSLQFTIEDEESLKVQARKAAIDEAKEKAQVLASQLNVKLGRIVNFNEGGSYPVYFESARAMDMGMGGAAPAPQIEPGENRIVVNVTIVYEIQ